MMTLIRAVWLYRGFVLGSVKREFQAKYGNAVLGAAWSALNPLAMILIYTVIFGQVMRNRLPGNDSTFAYSIYLCAGILTWGMFSEIALRGQTMFLDQANLMKKVSFPRICLPVIVVLNAGLNFAIIFGLFTGFLVLTGSFPGWIFLALLAGHGAGGSECVFQGRGAVLCNLCSILVLVYTHCVSRHNFADMGAGCPGAESDGRHHCGLSDDSGQRSGT